MTVPLLPSLPHLNCAPLSIYFIIIVIVIVVVIIIKREGEGGGRNTIESSHIHRQQGLITIITTIYWTNIIPCSRYNYPIL